MPLISLHCLQEGEDYGHRGSDAEGKEADDDKPSCGNQEQSLAHGTDSVVPHGLLTRIPVTKRLPVASGSDTQSGTPTDKSGSADSVARTPPRTLCGSDSSVGDAADSQLGLGLSAKDRGLKKRPERKSITKAQNVDDDVTVSASASL